MFDDRRTDVQLTPNKPTIILRSQNNIAYMSQTINTADFQARRAMRSANEIENISKSLFFSFLKIDNF